MTVDSPTSFGVEQLDHGVIEDLKLVAKQSAARRARACLHRSHEDPVQEMVIAAWSDSEFRPHRQVGNRKSYIMVEGRMIVAFFDEQFCCTKRVPMDAAGRAGAVLFTFDAGRWHNIYVETDVVVYLETLPGPHREGRTDVAEAPNGLRGMVE